MTKILITNLYGIENKGDQALFMSLLYDINKYWPDAKITALAYHVKELKQQYPSLTTLHPVTFVRHKYKKVIIPFLLLFLYFFGTTKFAFKLMSRERALAVRAYNNADIIIAAPGGYLEDSTMAYVPALFQIHFASKFRSKVILAPQSIGPLRSIFAKFYCERVLRHCEKIFLREKTSYDFVANLSSNIFKNAILTSDMALTHWDQIFDIRLKTERESSKTYVTFVDWNYPGKNKAKRYRDAYIDAFVTFMMSCNNEFGTKFIGLLQVDTDRKIYEDIASQLPRQVFYFDENIYSPQEMIEKIAGTHIFVGTRFHSCLYALKAETATIAISYLPKTRGIIETTELNIPVIDIENVNSEWLLRNYTDRLNESSNNSELTDKLSKLRGKSEFSAYLEKYANRY